MPTSAERLSSTSSDGQIKASISETIQKLMHEGYPQDQAIKIANEQAAKATGKELGKER